MGRPVQFAFAAPVTTAITTAQTLGAAGAFSLDGTLALKPSFIGQTVTATMGGGVQRTVSITSAGDVSAVNFTITGKDLFGTTVTETRAGPNATTVFTTATFATVTSITAGAAVASATSFGSGTTGSTNWFKPSLFAAPVNIGATVSCIPSGSGAAATVQDTPDPLDDPAFNGVATTTINHPTLTNVSTAIEGSYLFPVRYVRGVVTADVNSLVTFTFIENGS